MTGLHLSALGLLLIQMAVILVASRLTGVAFRRIGQPLVVAEIVAGILLGPSGLGVVSPTALATLFPAEGMAALSGVSQLGLVLFMFVVGLEFDFALVRSRGSLALAVSQYGIVVPFLLGALLSLGLYPVFATNDIPFVAFGLFIGASMSVTAFPVLARILSERGLMQSPIGALTLTCAAINDVSAWCLLACTIAVVRSGGLVDGLLTTAFAAVFIVVMMAGVRPLLARVAARYGTVDTLGQAAVAATLLLLLLSAIAAEVIGIHALFGAFLFGVAVPRQPHVIRGLVSRIEDLVVVLLLPMFFAFTGLRTQIGLVDTQELWGWCALVTGVATLGKLVGTALPGRLGGLGWRESATLGVLMNTRGLMELVILNIGRDLGVLSPLLFTMLVLMAVITTVVTSPIVRFLQPPERVLATKAGPESAVTTGVVLVCVSHPDSAPGLARMTAALSRGTGVRAWALHLVQMGDQATLFPEGEQARVEEDAAERLASEARLLGANVDGLTFPSSDPARDILAMATLKEADVVLLGLHRPLVGTAQLGGPLLEVAQRASQPVCMFHEVISGMPRRVLWVPGGDHSLAAQRIAQRLQRDSEVEVTTYVPPPGEPPIPALLVAATAYDLVVVGIGPEWGLQMGLFDVRDHPLLTDLPCSLLAVHRGRPET